MPYRTLGFARNTWQTLLAEGGALFEVALTDQIIDVMAAHAAEMVVWNRRMNLTAIRNVKEMAVKHYVDSLAPFPFLDTGDRVLDIGSGAGFPGIPLRIALPQIRLTLVDANRRKCSFLKHACRKIGLNDVQVRHAHLTETDDVRSTANHDPTEDLNSAFDVVTSRAVGPLTELVNIGTRFLKPGGRFIALKGPEEYCLRDSVLGQGGIEEHAYTLPQNYGQRRLIVLRPD